MSQARKCFGASGLSFFLDSWTLGLKMLALFYLGKGKDCKEIRMKIDFDKFNLTQKIFSILGLVSATVIYMVDKDNLNIAVGVVLLTALLVFLMRYKGIRILCNAAILVSCLSILLVGGFLLHLMQKLLKLKVDKETFLNQ